MEFSTKVRVASLRAEGEGAIAVVVDATDGQGDVSIVGRVELQLSDTAGIDRVGQELSLTFTV